MGSLGDCLDCEMMAVFYYQQGHFFVFVNFSQNEDLEQFHGKTVILDADHNHSPFPAPFMIQEIQEDFILGALTDQSPVHDLARILLTTIVEVWEMEVILGSALVGVAAWAPGGSGRAVSSISEPPSTGIISCSQQSFQGSRTGRIHAPPVATALRLEICNSRRIDLQGRGKRTPGNTSILLASLTSLKNSIIQVKS